MKYTRSIFIIIIIEQIREYPSILFDDINILDIRSLDSKRKKERGTNLFIFFPPLEQYRRSFALRKQRYLLVLKRANWSKFTDRQREIDTEREISAETEGRERERASFNYSGKPKSRKVWLAPGENVFIRVNAVPRNAGVQTGPKAAHNEMNTEAR